MNTLDQIRALINRLARLDAGETWAVDLNPAQIAALDYLALANRFSRAPSQVAEYLGTTRGTMSQTLKSLLRKGYLTERGSETDRRSISYDLTPSGIALAGRHGELARAVYALPAEDQESLSGSLSAILAARLSNNGGRAFGICNTCTYHRVTGDGAYCALLSLRLAPEETTQICYEQEVA
jgi:DNA-binding MarR family transcriptional regulator